MKLTENIGYSLEFNTAQRIHFKIFSHFGKYPTFTSCFVSIRGGLGNLIVQNNTNIVVEGPTGSANSYFVQGLVMANPEIRVAQKKTFRVLCCLGILMMLY